MDCVYESMNTEKKSFKRFVFIRWLSEGPVVPTVIECWPALKKYFLQSTHS
jgi:hypothetical protein